MTDRARFLTFALLGLLLVVGLERLPLQTKVAKDQVQPNNQSTLKKTIVKDDKKAEKTQKLCLYLFMKVDLFIFMNHVQRVVRYRKTKPVLKKLKTSSFLNVRFL